MYNFNENIYTYINTKNEKSDPIKILKGVKQGDPPLLYSLALDPLLCKLETQGKGYQHGKNSTAMAFAEELVLSDSWEGMTKNIKILEIFCDLTALRPQGEKFHGFYIKPTKDSYTIDDCPAWTVSGTPLNGTDPGISEKNLGLQSNPRTGNLKLDYPQNRRNGYNGLIKRH